MPKSRPTFLRERSSITGNPAENIVLMPLGIKTTHLLDFGIRLSVSPKQHTLAVSVLLLLLPLPVHAVQMHEEPTHIPWTQATPNGLTALLVYARLPGKHPLVVITHGTSREIEPRNNITPWILLPQARWFARRGFVALVVVRRGYGSSGGKPDYLGNGDCPEINYENAARKSSEDLRVAIDFGSKLPQVDPTRVLAVGVSTGGMATVALTSDAPKNLVAAINFAGGRGSIADHEICNSDALVAAYRDFGRHSRTPMLWIYADNDKYFWPEIAQQFDAAFRSTGGQDQFLHAPAFGEDGHTLFSHGIAIWSPMVDDFLKAHALALLPEPLPEITPPDIPPPEGLSDRGQQAFHNYLTLGPHKAFALSVHHYASSVAQMTSDDARKDALKNCNRLAAPDKETCSIAFEENSPAK
jgi:dienelactone hydrolase